MALGVEMGREGWVSRRFSSCKERKEQLKREGVSKKEIESKRRRRRGFEMRTVDMDLG